MRTAPSANDFDRLLLSFSRYLWILVLLTISAAFLSYFVSRLQPGVYEATARLLSAEPINLSSTINAPQVRPLAAAAYREAAYGTLVLERLRGRFPGVLPKENSKVREKMRIRSIETVGSSSIVFVLSVRDSNPKQAAEIANAWAEALQEWEVALLRENFRRVALSLDKRLDWVNTQITRTSNRDDLAGLRELRANLERELGIARSLENSAAGQLSILARAEVPSQAISPRPLRTAAIAAFATLLLGFIILTVQDRLLSSRGSFFGK